MDATLLQRESEYRWLLPPAGPMRVPAVLYASELLIHELDAKVLEQIGNVAALPGIETASYAMPDAHWGYGFPIGGVAAFDAERGGVVSAGGVGFDISCGVRTVLTGIPADELLPQQEKLANTLFAAIPAGVGSTGKLRLVRKEMDAMLSGGARWAVQRGYGLQNDLDRIEHRGEISGACPENISEKARQRQQDEMGTLGSGNHYLEVQQVAEILDAEAARVFGLRANEIVISIHCGSRGLGHQVATEYSRSMVQAAQAHGIALPDRELACAPLQSAEGQAYLGAMRAAINCALANRQILTHLAREVLQRMFPATSLPLLYDVSHNTCSVEKHVVAGAVKELFVHRKGATRAFGPGHPDLPQDLRATGQPVLIGGSMGTASYILAGTAASAELSFSSACHGAGRRLSRTQATKKWQGRDVINNLARKNILIRAESTRGVAEEAPGAYKDVDEVVAAASRAGLARLVARLTPLICIKG
jgi:tRNA-splicing ligase RtcB